MNLAIPFGVLLLGLIVAATSGKAKAGTRKEQEQQPKGDTIASPFAGVAALAWSKFVAALARGQEGTITPTARYGRFLFGVRRLADLGLVQNVKRGTYQGKTVWTGDWTAPYSLNAFLSSSRLQYQAFVKSMTLWAKKYKPAKKANPAIFRIDGKPLSLSGFLALCHLAGFMGAVNFLKSGKRLPATMALVQKVNGLF